MAAEIKSSLDSNGNKQSNSSQESNRSQESKNSRELSHHICDFIVMPDGKIYLLEFGNAFYNSVFKGRDSFNKPSVYEKMRTHLQGFGKILHEKCPLRNLRRNMNACSENYCEEGRKNVEKLNPEERLDLKRFFDAQISLMGINVDSEYLQFVTEFLGLMFMGNSSVSSEEFYVKDYYGYYSPKPMKLSTKVAASTPAISKSSDNVSGNANNESGNKNPQLPSNINKPVSNMGSIVGMNAKQ